MGSDTQPHLAGDAPAVTPAAPRSETATPAMPAPATTASMQSLLAQYFETKHFETKHFETPQRDAGEGFEPTRIHALSTARSETRTLSPGEQIAALLPQMERTLQPAAVMPTVSVPEQAPPVPHEGWPLSAQSLINSLMAENERLRADVQTQKDLRHAAEAQADSDVLTPTLNRRAFLREMQRAMADCRRYGEQACLIFLDMDGFKSINDNYGHAAGDIALNYVAETLKTSVREGDSVGRIGGDEFAILLRRADINSSRIKALKLEAELALGTFEHKGLYLKTGGSFGVRAYAGQASAEAWLSEADAAMFLVKKASR